MHNQVMDFMVYSGCGWWRGEGRGPDDSLQLPEVSRKSTPTDKLRYGKSPQRIVRLSKSDWPGLD